MAEVTLEDCVREFRISVELLDIRVSDEHLLKVSEFLQWKRIAPYLKLKDSEVEGIDLGRSSEQEKRYKALQTWKNKFAFKATYKRLIEALLGSGRADHAEVCKMLSSLAPQKGTYITRQLPICVICTDTETANNCYADVLRPA